MKINYRHLAIAMLLAASTAALSQSATWQAEVTIFRSVEIGMSLSALPECPKRKHKFLNMDEYIPDYESTYPVEMKDKLCWKATKDKPIIPGTAVVIISNLPFIKGMGREAVATIIDGAIESIESRFLAHYARTIQQALVEKYGPPSWSEQRLFQNKLGARFSGASLAWYGQRVTLTFDEVDDSIDWGVVTMRSRKYDSALKATFESSKESVKRGL